MKGIIAWFEQLADDMRFFADKARNFRRNFPNNIKQKMEALKSTKESSTSANQSAHPLALNVGSVEPYPMATPAYNDDLVNVMSPFNGYSKTII
ncbi:TPA: hypothetical protein AB5C39_001821 [Vibrio mimicus]|uniref:hypothetical protein n=1 Tax=Vibrio cholerae TaxID=666 RepID=UPI001E00576B|nr:hypothetical protein [Vibrio cholerae]EJL6307322.1 hypothetical protein [Vibrio cholerae]EJL6310971.1 hypothetical protein [Vibrio cholerae]EJL6582307.1 hypothetical protein [Vibrio cholerae]EKA4522918.1 hypothetical protein [Vibrio cholerae]